MMPTREAETGDLVIAPGPDGRTWLWPLEGADQPTAAEPLKAPWEIVEVAIEQRRRLHHPTEDPTPH